MDVVDDDAHAFRRHREPPGRLHLVPHVNAPVADFPVRRVIGAHHFLADLTLPYGRVVFDYNKEVDAVAQQAAE